jgi:hypothetical protein
MLVAILPREFSFVLLNRRNVDVAHTARVIKMGLKFLILVYNEQFI